MMSQSVKQVPDTPPSGKLLTLNAADDRPLNDLILGRSCSPFSDETQVLISASGRGTRR